MAFDNVITVKEAWKKAWSKSRQIRKAYPDIKAYFVAEQAINHCIYGGGYDYKSFLTAERAVIWAIHWQFEAPREDLPKWTSERWLGFAMTSEGSEVWFDNPRLP